MKIGWAKGKEIKEQVQLICFWIYIYIYINICFAMVCLEGWLRWPSSQGSQKTVQVMVLFSELAGAPADCIWPGSMEPNFDRTDWESGWTNAVNGLWTIVDDCGWIMDECGWIMDGLWMDYPKKLERSLKEDGPSIQSPAGSVNFFLALHEASLWHVSLLWIGPGTQDYSGSFWGWTA